MYPYPSSGHSLPRDRKPPSAEEVLAKMRVDELAQTLMLTNLSKRARKKRLILLAYLDLDETQPPSILRRWPTQTEVAQLLGVTCGQVSLVAKSARHGWSLKRPLRLLRDEIATLLETHEGIMTSAELAEGVLHLRGSVSPEPQRTREASAVARAAIEAERKRKRPRWLVRCPRKSPFAWVARHVLDEDGAPIVDGQRMLYYAERLREKAEGVFTTEIDVSTACLVMALSSLKVPDGLTPPSEKRLGQLVTAITGLTHLEPRQDPPGPDEDSGEVAECARQIERATRRMQQAIAEQGRKLNEAAKASQVALEASREIGQLMRQCAAATARE